MLKTKNRILSSILAITISFTFFLSLGRVNALTNVPDEYDVYGASIADMIPRFAYDSMMELWSEDLPEESRYGSFVFLDSQLLDYDFVQDLCGAFPDRETGDVGLVELYTNYGIRLFVHESDWTFTDITWRAIEGVSTGYTYDFSIQQNFETIYGLIDQVAMCGIGIWSFDTGLYNFLYVLQNAWNDRMPIYIIERDPVAWGDDGLMLNIYSDDEFIFQSDGDEDEAMPGEV